MGRWKESNAFQNAIHQCHAERVSAANPPLPLSCAVSRDRLAWTPFLLSVHFDTFGRRFRRWKRRRGLAVHLSPRRHLQHLPSSTLWDSPRFKTSEAWLTLARSSSFAHKPCIYKNVKMWVCDSIKRPHPSRSPGWFTTTNQPPESAFTFCFTNMNNTLQRDTSPNAAAQRVPGSHPLSSDHREPVPQTFVVVEEQRPAIQSVPSTAPAACKADAAVYTDGK